MKFRIVVVLVFIMALLALNASAGCGRWVVRDNTDYLGDPTFDSLTSAAPKETASEGNSSAIDSIDSTQQKEKENKAPVLDVSGKWKVLLGETSETSIPLNLILIQSGERVQGYGSLNEDGVEIPATVMGSVSEDAVSLDAKLIGGSLNKIDKEYKLGLAKAEDAFTGNYELYVAGKLSEKGNATAVRSGQ